MSSGSRACGPTASPATSAIDSLRDRFYLAHVKNRFLRDDGSDFRALDDGIVDYAPIIAKLREVGFGG
jgi:sugar phosphate isomerase/epimerase